MTAGFFGVAAGALQNKKDPQGVDPAGEEQSKSEEILIASDTADPEENVDETQPPKVEKARARNFQFPLSGLNTAPAKIRFTAFKIEPFFNLDRVIEEPQNNTEETNAESEEDEKTTLLQDAKNGLKAIGEFIESYKNVNAGNDIGSVTLPMHNSLNYTDGVTYNNADLGLLAAAPDLDNISEDRGRLGAAAKAVGSQLAAKAAGAGLAAGTGATLSKVLGSGGAGGALVGAVAGSNIADAAGAAARASTRVQTAPNERTLFERVNLRTFNFSFTMIARNRAEADQIRGIVKFFREETYPEAIRLDDGGAPFAYEFPNVFQIDIINKNKRNPAFKIGRCYLETVTTNFNGTATGFYDGGDNFVEVAISLSFREIEALDKAKVRDQGF